MDACAVCGQSPSDTRPAFRSGGSIYHLACAPTDFLESAAEEYRAILRKGIRYFVDKYSVRGSETAEPGPVFAQLGPAIEAERERRR
jgi:hypothetical protein